MRAGEEKPIFQSSKIERKTKKKIENSIFVCVFVSVLAWCATDGERKKKKGVGIVSAGWVKSR